MKTKCQYWHKVPHSPYLSINITEYNRKVVNLKAKKQTTKTTKDNALVQKTLVIKKSVINLFYSNNKH